MRARIPLASLATAALVATVLATAVPAGAATTTHDPDDPTWDSTTSTVATDADLIGAGSDTSQHALHLIGEAWNSQSPAPAFRLASFSATGGGNIGLPGGDIARPNGSGAGKALLYGTGNNPHIDFARSSSSLNTNEVNAGLKQFPFAKDTLQMAVSADVPSHAPTALSGAQIVAIYKCSTTAATWDQVGGTGTTAIKPYVPQSGSGTRSFFLAQLTALNGGTAISSGTCWNTMQEHDPTLIQGDADALAPFSAGRAGLINAGTAHLRLLDGTITDPGTNNGANGPGWHADRALYNVVRGTDDPSGAGIGLGNAQISAMFGEGGFVCSAAATDLIKQAGFDQLATPSHGGVCGQATQQAASNFTLNQPVATTTSLAGSSPAGGSAKLTATVTATTAPSGSVQFFEGSTPLGTPMPLVQGAATVTLTGQTVGSHTYTAKFSPDDSAQIPSQADATVYVKSGSTTAVSVAPAAAYGIARTITVKVMAGTTAAAGTVKVGYGTVSRTLTLSGGQATLSVPATTKAGSYTATATYNGTDTVAPSTARTGFVIAKAAPKLTESFPATVKHGRTLAGTVTVAIAGSTVKPTGTVVIKKGTRILAKAQLVAGKASFKGLKLQIGKNKLTAVYGGSADVNKGSLTFLVKQL